MRRLILEIDHESDPIAGRLGDERGMRPFIGWLELAAAIQAALDPVVVLEDLPADRSIAGPART